jgi:undecaprenyl-diphosphatase
MAVLYILVLAVLQGLTEFLPVSSSAHLALAPRLFNEQDQGVLVDVALHVGTLLATLVYYRKDVFSILRAMLHWHDPATKTLRNLGIYIVLATIPALLMGLVLHVLYPDGIRSIAVITATTLFFGVLMGIADLKGRQEKEVAGMNLGQALLIGIAQSIALIPGTSRSGITMTAARFLGFKRADAARFSFLLGMPAMAAAGCLGLLEILEKGNPGLLHDSIIAACFSFLAGLAAIHFMLRWLNRFGLMPYVVYRILLGLFLLVHFLL